MFRAVSVAMVPVSIDVVRLALIGLLLGVEAAESGSVGFIILGEVVAEDHDRDVCHATIKRTQRYHHIHQHYTPSSWDSARISVVRIQIMFTELYKLCICGHQ